MSRIRDSINVTPLADVMLVLLVIFMVVTPMLKPGMGLPTPEAGHARERGMNERALVLSLHGDGSLFLNRTPLAEDRVLLTLSTLLRERSDEILFLEAAEGLDYGEVLEVMELCRRAGAEGVALVTRDPRTSS